MMFMRMKLAEVNDNGDTKLKENINHSHSSKVDDEICNSDIMSIDGKDTEERQKLIQYAIFINSFDNNDKEILEKANETSDIDTKLNSSL